MNKELLVFGLIFLLVALALLLYMSYILYQGYLEKDIVYIIILLLLIPVYFLLDISYDVIKTARKGKI